MLPGGGKFEMFGSNRKPSRIPQAFSSARRTSINQTPVTGRPPSHTGYSTARSSRSGVTGGQRYSLAMSGAPSTASKRSSSFFKALANPSSLKDPRNLNDRHIQQQMQRKVFQHLFDMNYSQLNEKLVKSPTKAEFSRMFEFIFQHLESGFTLKKIEEEMPRLFRALGYPFPLKPSTMQTIGAAHAMPHLLGAVSWLIDLILMAEEVSPQDLLLANEEGDGQRRSITYGYTVRCHKKYSNNAQLGYNMDNYSDENNVLLQIIEEKEEITHQEAEVNAQITNLFEETAEICNDKGELDKLQADTKTLEDDLERLNAFRDEQRGKLDSEKKRRDSLEQELQEFGAKIANLKKQFSLKEKQLATQAMSGEEARSLRIRKDELKARIEEANEERQNIDVENEAILSVNFKGASQLRERYQACVRTFEDMSRTVNGMDDSFFAVLEQHSPNEPHFPEFIAQIEEKLNELVDKVNNSIKNMEDALTTTNQHTAELKQRKAVLAESLKKLQRQTSKTSHDFSLKREDWEVERRKMTLDMDVAQNELDSLHQLRNGKLFAHEQLAEVRKKLQSRQIEVEDTKKKVVAEAALKFGILVDLWDNLKKCHDQIRNDEKLLREALDDILDASD